MTNQSTAATTVATAGTNAHGQPMPTDLKAVVARIEADIALLRQACNEPISIKLSEKIDIEVRPADEDDRVLVGRSDWGYTVVNYTTEGLILDVIAEDELEPVYTTSIHKSDLEVLSPDDLSSAAQ